MKIFSTSFFVAWMRSMMVCILAATLYGNLLAQPLNDCTGMSVANGFFNDAWIPGIGTWDVFSGVPSESVPVQQWVSNRHAIKSAADGNIPDIMVEDVPYIPPGSNISHVVQLGNNLDEAPNGYGFYERLSTSFVVDSTNNLLQIWFAVILQKPNHNAVRQPKFAFKVFDQNHNLLPCGNYEVIAYGNIPGFKYQDKHDLVYRTWTSASIDLRDRTGEQVTIEFSTYDCADGGHFGFALFAIQCLSAEIRPTHFYCPGVDNTITLKAPNGFQNYVWSNGSTGQVATFSNPQGGETVSVTFNPFSSLDDSCKLTLEYKIPLSVDIIVSPTVSFCESSSKVIHAEGPPGSTYLWNTGASTPSISASLPGVYYVTVTKEACHLQDSVQVAQVNLPHTELSGIEPSCYGLADGSVCSALLQVGTPVTYQWSNGGSDACLVQLAAGNYSLTVTENQLGCTATAGFFLDEPEDLTLTVEMLASPGCDNRDEGELLANFSGGTAPYEIVWSNGQSDETAVIYQSGHYLVTVTDAHQCSKMDSIEVLQLSFNTEKSDNYCFRGSEGWIKAEAESGVAPYQYSIAPKPFGAVSAFNGLTSGTYLVAVQDASGCILADTVFILEKRSAPYEIFLTPGDTSIVLGQSVSFELKHNFPTEKEDVEWHAPFSLDCAGCFDPSGTPLNDGVLQVWAKDIYGCPDTAQMRIQVEKNYHVYAPNIFRPEYAQEESNRLWTVFFSPEQVEEVIFMRVFSRWGELVFKHRNFKAGDQQAFWNGIHNGQQAEAGVYVWQVFVRFIDGVEKAYSGNLTLWRGK